MKHASNVFCTFACATYSCEVERGLAATMATLKTPITEVL